MSKRSTKRSTTEDFINKAKEVHGETYDYSLVEYINNKTYVSILCKVHGVFTQIPNAHLRGKGCRECSNPTFNTEEFISRAKKVHGDAYDYSLVSYINKRHYVKIICKTHGVFEQEAGNHMYGAGCKLCGRITIGITNNNTARESFISKAVSIYGYTYGYEESKYVDKDTKLRITCNIHGAFYRSPHEHLYKNKGCPECAKLNRSSPNKYDLDTFLSKAIEVHGGKYDYSKVEYSGSKDVLEIICPHHGLFKQRACEHLRGHGCKYCGKYNGYFRRLIPIRNKSEEGILYLLKIKQDNDTYLKLGITARSVARRYSRAEYKNLNITEIHSAKLKIGQLCRVEQYLLKKYIEYSYEPTQKFAGHTECLEYSEDLILKIKKDLENYEQLINTTDLLQAL